ncbi:MAG: YgfZ/GcvT domain-containing protein [Microvirga sp.]|nr:folate-binding protein [Beijerinckiaceae bacterium]HZY22111.1 folate-binding protein [Beijerinckiaceae bacterium]
MPTAHLSDRGVVRVSGADARPFLDGLVTCDLDKVGPDRPRFGALLTPQGKLLFDFLLFEAPQDAGGGFYLDCLRFMAPDLAKRLGFYKLRAKVAVEDLSETLAVVAGWGDAPKPDDAIGLVGGDPRLKALGWRAIVAAEDAAALASPAEGEAESREARPGEGESATPGHGAYHAHRVALGVPEGGKDFLFNDTFPHEALMDQLNGIDFDKGCYIGQEVVSRMQHRGTARTRIVPVVYEDGFTAEPWSEVTAGERRLGKVGTGANGRGLVMIRLDRAADALAAGETIRAGGMPVRIEKPDFVGFPFPGEAATPAA